MATEVAAAVVFDKDRVLLARRSPGKREGGMWEFPGGKREANETIAQALARELLEEFAVEARVHEELLRCHHRYPHGSIVLIAMRTEIDDFPRDLHDHDRIEWVPIGQLKQYHLAPADIPIVEYLMHQKRI